MIRLLDKLALPIGIILLLGLLVGAYFLNRATPNQKANDDAQLVVDVAGAVNNPGVYQFNSGAIIEDAITQAGGITENADTELIALTINRAALLASNGKVYIPVKGGTTATTTSPAPASASGSITGVVNINTANAAGLDALPGIGPVYAGRIIDYRNQHGNFQRKEDLMKVSGISASTYNKLKDKITI